jgi:hypothetical protein
MQQLLWAILAATAIASPYASSERRAVTFTIETAPGESRDVTEAEKDTLKDVSCQECQLVSSKRVLD